MKKYSRYFIVLIMVGSICLLSNDLMACAMCKETGNAASGFNAKGLNSGILYLMVIPYIAFSVLGYFWYKTSKRERAQEQRLVQPLKGE